MARYLVKLSTSCKYTTINNHLSAVCVLHKFYGYEAGFCESFLIKMVLVGIKSKYGTAVVSKTALSLDQLRMMHNVLPKTELNEILWTAIMFSFHTLLRKSNIVPCPNTSHTLCRSDITFTSKGMVVVIGSSKNLKYKQRQLQIPVFFVSDPAFCVVSRLLKHFALYPADDDSPLFFKRVSGRVSPVSYNDLLTFIKSSVARIGLNPSDMGMYSLRRSGATYLHGIGVPLIDIKVIGDWMSLAVLQYLITTFDRKCDIESYFVSTLL